MKIITKAQFILFFITCTVFTSGCATSPELIRLQKVQDSYEINGISYTTWVDKIVTFAPKSQEFDDELTKGKSSGTGSLYINMPQNIASGSGEYSYVYTKPKGIVTFKWRVDGLKIIKAAPSPYDKSAINNLQIILVGNFESNHNIPGVRVATDKSNYARLNSCTIGNQITEGIATVYYIPSGIIPNDGIDLDGFVESGGPIFKPVNWISKGLHSHF